MNPLCHSGIPVPSAALLRFLKHQTEAFPFFTSNSTSGLQISLAQRACKWWRKTSHGTDSRPTSGSLIQGNVLSALRENFQQWRKGQSDCMAPDHLPCQSLCSSILYLPHRLPTSHAAVPSRTISQRAQNRADILERRSRWRLWKMGRRPDNDPMRPDDLPTLGSFLDDGAGFGRILKPTADLRLRCTELDEKGNVTLVSGEFKKSELIQKVCECHLSLQFRA